MTRAQPDTDHLLRSVCAGDASARSQLLVRHRERLRRMVAVRLDRRLMPRVDPSDVVQEALLEADRHLDDYARQRPIPFYPWLRQIAWGQMVAAYRKHVLAQSRSVTREEARLPSLPDESALDLARRLVAADSGPDGPVQREELRRRMQEALNQLSEHDREVLVLRHLERLSVGEIAAVMGVSENAASARHLRALRRLRELLGTEEEQP